MSKRHTRIARLGMGAFLLLGCFVALGAVKPLQTIVIEGKAFSSSIHSCNTEVDADLPGYCNGVLTVEYPEKGRVVYEDIIVTAKVPIERDGKKPATLDSFIGSWVRVEYVKKDGLFFATSVVARTAGK